MENIKGMTICSSIKGNFEMTAQQNQTYYGAIAIRTGSNAITAIYRGASNNLVFELARNAAKFAFAAYPELRA